MLILPDRAGPHDPLLQTSARRPGSVRRTSSIDSTRPDGVFEDVRIDGRARDLRTRSGDDARSGGVVLDQVALSATTEPGKALKVIDADPAAPGLQELIGAPVASGFRQRATDALPDDADGKTLLNLIVDDLPGAALVSGIALQRSFSDGIAGPGLREHILGAADICAGWASDASIIVAFKEHDQMPVPIGPPAPALERPDDPVGWHPMAELPPNGTRRRRCLDLWPEPGADGGTHGFEAHFRDSYVDEHGDESVVHEYLVTGRIDGVRLVVTAIDAQARVLPWLECPGALASAGRLVGTPIGDLRARVRAEFTGQSTCTHLNDQLRTLADLEPLLQQLDQP